MYPVVRFGDLAISTHDLFSVLAVLVGFAIYYRELRQRGWLESRIVWISLAALLGGKEDVGGKTVLVVASGGNVSPADFFGHIGHA